MSLFDILKKDAQNSLFSDEKHYVSEALTWANDVIEGIYNTELGWGNNSHRIIGTEKQRVVVLLDFDLRPGARIMIEDIGENQNLDNPDENPSEETAGEQKLGENWEESATDSVLNLQYFFPLCDQALRNDPQREMILIIVCSGDDVWRIRRYLSAQNRIKPRLCICTATMENNLDISELILSPVYYSVKNIKNLLPLFCVGRASNVCCEDSQKPQVDDLTVKVLSDTNEALYNYCSDGKKTKTDVENRPQYTMLLRTGEYIIDRINKKIIGSVTTESKLTERKNKCKAFWDIVNGERGGLKRQSLLTQVIWISTLWHLMEQDELEQDGSEEPFAKDRIYLALWDAIAYGEGILQLLENSEIHSQHHVGYLSICIHDVGLTQISEVDKAAKRRISIYRKYRLNSKDSFIQTNECCYLEFNVIDMGLDERYVARGIEVMAGYSLKELFGGTAGDGIEHVVHHYGMPLFYQTVLRKNGRFICRTPAGNGSVVQFVHGKSVRKTQPEPQYATVDNGQAWTSYQVLLPVSFQLYQTDGVKTIHSQMFDHSFLTGDIMPYRYKQRLIEKDELLSQKIGKIEFAMDKIAVAKEISGKLSTILNQAKEPTVYVLKLIGMSAQSLELYIKGLFHFIAGEAEAHSERRLLFRLIFMNEFALSEALRRFAIFYDRYGRNAWMEHAQIALCVLEEDNTMIPHSQVRLILAGQHIYEAYISAKQYLHYNTDIDSGFLLSQIEYLAKFEKKENEVITGVPLFPFEIVEDIDGQSDFRRKIETQLSNDFQRTNYGCKIVNAHVRLGSKIHIKDFYDAELLFQSIPNIYRFAYILAGEIYQNMLKEGIEKFSTLLLIGYENYSSILVEEVTRLLTALLREKWPRRKISIEHLSYVKMPDDSETIVPGRNEVEMIDDKLAIVMIMPIGTTLSTIYKIKNVFQREFGPQEKLTILDSHVLILVDDSAPKGEKLSDEYWCECQPKKLHRIKLQPETQDMPHCLEVQWYFKLETKWMKPLDCELCGKVGESAEAALRLRHIPLTQVDKTSTIPGLIFPLKNAERCHGIGFSARGSEEQQLYRLSKMKGCIEYGHIHRDRNHYQFYIQYEKYYAKIRNDCIKWLDEQRQSINENEFNIIISPLQYENSLFIKDVIDHVFQHSLRFIYLSLDQVYREEIRSRFSYIAQEYQNACTATQPPKYNVYFVDYSVVSGQSLRRSEMLIRMLMNDANTGENVRIFRKVILLVNRSSYDTAAVFVREPKTDFIAYSTLQIPSYNTLSNSCPACEMADTYQTIADCSATNEVYWHYYSLKQKHQLRNLEEHKKWVKEFHFMHPRYLKQFYQNLRLNMNAKNRDNQDAVTEIEKTAGVDGALAGMTLQKVVDESGNKEKIAVLQQYEMFIAERNWRRLLCTHQAVQVVENMSDQNWDARFVALKVWQVIAQGVCEFEQLAERREWLISYIKTFSRGYPAKFAPIRKAIYLWLEILFFELLEQSSKHVDNIKLCKDYPQLDTSALDLLDKVLATLKIENCKDPAESFQLYQIYQVLAKRLCDLQSNLLLQYDVMCRIERFLGNLKMKHESLLEEMISTEHGKENFSSGSDKTTVRLLSFPTDNEIQAGYLYLIKWAAMSSKEESKAFLLQTLSKEIADAQHRSGGNIQNEWHPLNCAEFSQMIRVENTRVLYSGIKRLNERTQETEDWKNLKQKIQDIWINACSRNEKKYLAQNPMMDLFRFMDADLTDEEPSRFNPQMDTDLTNKKPPSFNPQGVEILAALLGFYRTVDPLKKSGALQENKDYIEQYNTICLWLSRIGGYRNCYMIHRSNHVNQIVAQYFSETIEKLDDLVDQVLDRTISAAGSQYDGMSLANTVYTDKQTDALVISLRISRNPNIKHLQTIYIMLLNRDDSTKGDGETHGEKLDARIYYILFMRQRLQMILERDLYALHHFRNGLEDVRRIGKQALRILHITDMHISAYNVNAILDLITSNKEQLKNGNPELMVVTGDVVQGNNSAADLEENYKYAAQVLRAIAEILWSFNGPDGRKIIHNDWKKRIIIIPGNHDYASMNELSANHTLRTTTGGVPALRNGTPMSKYAYYIQFLQDFLGIDSSQSIRRNLNSFLEYPDLKLRIIALNSVAEVGPIRNNKMQLDDAFIQFVCNKRFGKDTWLESDDYLTIGLAHHTRCYEPDYFADRYYEKGLTKEIFSFTKKIMAICAQGQKALSNCLSTGIWQNAKEIIDRTNEDIATIQEDNPQEYKVFTEQCNKTTLFSDISYLCDHWSELTNERCAQILSDYERNQAMAQFDLRVYQERLKLLEEKFPIDFMLGGHTHRAGRTQDSKIRPCVEGAQFYSEHESPTQLHFGFLDIEEKDGKRSCEYVFSGNERIVELHDSSELLDSNQVSP